MANPLLDSLSHPPKTSPRTGQGQRQGQSAPADQQYDKKHSANSMLNQERSGSIE
jgi:hypothetical protein